MMKKIKNFELVTLALYACGGTKKQGGECGIHTKI